MTGVPLQPFKPDHLLYTETSEWNWGATLGTEGNWSRTESELHSNNREMLAAIRAMQEFRSKLTNSKLLIYSDNITTVATINK